MILENTKKARIDITPYGQTSQYSTSGKNIFNDTTVKRTVPTRGAINVVVNNVTIEAGTYRFACFVDNQPVLTNNIYSMSFRNGQTGVAGSAVPNSTITVTSEQASEIDNVLLYFNSNFTDAYKGKEITGYMICSGNDLGDYEPFTNGPAPNPDYPYPIKKVTGDNNIKIENRNLFDIHEFENQLVTGKILNDNGVEVNDNSSAYSKYMIYLKANTTYHIKGYFQRIYYFNENKVFKSRSSPTLTIRDFSYTPTENEYIEFQIHNATWEANKGQEQIEFGGVATDYVEHEEQNYPLTLGDLEVYKDGYFFKNEIDSEDYNSNLDLNEWYLKNYYGKVVLDGSESWQNWNIVTTEPLVGFLLDGYVDYDNSSGTDVRGLSNYFKVFANAMPTQQSIGLRQTGDSIKRIYLAISNEIVSNLTEFKSWLLNHNTELVYLSATPIYKKVTSQTLIEQLNNLKNNAKSYKDVTYITQTNDELPFILEIKEIEDDQLIDDLSKINEFLRVNL